jgi:DNA-binding FrmR family transcriptional regulator
MRGYSASKDDLLKRLARVEGQVRGVSRMVDDERYCIDVVTQINAVRAALDKIALGLVDDHVRHCLKDTRRADQDADELINAVARMLSR